MPATPQPLAARLARWLLACALRYWPEETREWGMALAAEIDETRDGVEALQWSLGGIMFFLRSVLSSAFAWMKLPAGASLSTRTGSESTGPSIFPKRSRLFVAVVLAAAGVLLFMPQGREAISTVRASWSEFQPSASDQRALDKLAIRAEKDHDAATLAFVALRVDQPERFAALADRAVALDPQFVWVYGARRSWPGKGEARDQWIPAREEWLERLQASDPDNAVPNLLAADRIAKSLLDRQPRPDWAASQSLLANDAKWTTLMARAFAAPRYGSYFPRHFELTKSVWNRERYLSPSVVLTGLWAYAIPNLMNMRAFADLRAKQAELTFAAGDRKEAEQLLTEVDGFGEKMANADSTLFERLIGLSIAAVANDKLGKLYAGSGLTAEADRFASRAKELEMRAGGPHRSADPARRDRERTFERWGIFVQSFAGLTIIAAAALLVALLLLELLPPRLASQRPRWRKAMCWTADYAPFAVLAASGAFLCSFRPYAHALAEYRAAESALAGEQLISSALWSLFAVPSNVMNPRFLIPMWYAITLALAALAVFVIARSIYRARHFPVSHT